MKSKRIQYRGISVRTLCETFCPQSRLQCGSISNTYRPIIRYGTSRTGREIANVAASGSNAEVTGNNTALDVRLKMKRKIAGEGIVIIVIDREKE
ncbi:hypothetical protein [Bacillus haynesii]|uniref:hypothetical protein n=1 Tax=Bacillus haynesii TaxID=1925021 RepID=UPI0022826165|nr:hypothetical protein [Bacillus haynesii]MCY7800866.1 hypothetical protein [Bacillus haynesii]